MPAEEGYPAYLPSKLSSFYERAGVVKVLGKRYLGDEITGSLTIIGTISPPGGDFSEPVTATTKRVVQTFWALDAKLAYLKHYPAINWLNSYSNYPEYIKNWWNQNDINWSEIDIDWYECRKQVNEILSKENDLKYITQLLGVKNLPEDQRLDLFIAKIIKNGFLNQSAFDKIDNFTDFKKLMAHIKIILLLYKEGKDLIEQGFIIEEKIDEEIVNDILRIGHSISNEDIYQIEKLKNKLLEITKF